MSAATSKLFDRMFARIVDCKHISSVSYAEILTVVTASQASRDAFARMFSVNVFVQISCRGFSTVFGPASLTLFAAVPIIYV